MFLNLAQKHHIILIYICVYICTCGSLKKQFFNSFFIVKHVRTIDPYLSTSKFPLTFILGELALTGAGEEIWLYNPDMKILKKFTFLARKTRQEKIRGKKICRGLKIQEDIMNEQHLRQKTTNRWRMFTFVAQ